MDPLTFSKGVTYDAGQSGGSAPACADNVRAGWAVLTELGETDKGLYAEESTDACHGFALSSAHRHSRSLSVV